MALRPDTRFQLRTDSMSAGMARDAAIDVGLRQYMLRVYNYMASGLALTGVVAYLVASTPAVLQLLYQPTGTGGYAPTMLAWIAMFSPLAFILVMNFGLHKMKASTLQMVFWAFAAVMGVSMSSIFLTFTGASIARVFFISASMFLAMSIYGYTTKRDLSGMGSFLMMGLVGIIVASIVNIFLASSGLHFVISVVGVLVFVGLTAFDTQKIKSMYMVSDSGEIATKKAVMGATTLYLDFINLFMMLLHLFGNRE
ncbi:MAG: Bax inhibitor-1/YccA family protein [Hyphomicrobiales bacterium]|nr:Bax inhibitor-1/YccA family protein [Hyphomicrobiales bacterium]MCP5370317.1 Bax inhibitor-1/YccA family protein [Hyphomicrobiales bacterium]